jgi:hypothetical protein
MEQFFILECVSEDIFKFLFPYRKKASSDTNSLKDTVDKEHKK